MVKLTALTDRVKELASSTPSMTQDDPPQRTPVDPVVTPLLLVDAYTTQYDEETLDGVTRLVKLTFLFETERLDHAAYRTPDLPTYNYMSADYGPYSTHLVTDIDDLPDDVITSERISNLGNQMQQYTLGDRLNDHINDQFDETPISRTDVQDTVDEYINFIGSMRISRLLEYTFNRHPEYTDNATI